MAYGRGMELDGWNSRPKWRASKKRVCRERSGGIEYKGLRERGERENRTRCGGGGG